MGLAGGMLDTVSERLSRRLSYSVNKDIFIHSATIVVACLSMCSSSKAIALRKL